MVRRTHLEMFWPDIEICNANRALAMAGTICVIKWTGTDEVAGFTVSPLSRSPEVV